MKKLFFLFSFIFISTNSSAVESTSPSIPTLKQKLAEKEAQLDKLAQDYEGFAMGEWLKQMAEGIKPDPLLGGGEAENLYKQLLYEEYGKEFVKKGGTGIADSISTKLKKHDSEYNSLKRQLDEHSENK